VSLKIYRILIFQQVFKYKLRGTDMARKAHMKLDIVNALYALAQESRLALFRALVQAGPDGLAAGALATNVGIGPSSVSFHMKELVNAHLASSRSEGRFVIYNADFAAMNTLVAYLTDHCCGGKSCLPALPRKLRKPAP
jgi:DNA-binding transcriptional ArsR family regulator